MFFSLTNSVFLPLVILNAFFLGPGFFYVFQQIVILMLLFDSALRLKRAFNFYRQQLVVQCHWVVDIISCFNIIFHIGK